MDSVNQSMRELVEFLSQQRGRADYPLEPIVRCYRAVEEGEHIAKSMPNERQQNLPRLKVLLQQTEEQNASLAKQIAELQQTRDQVIAAEPPLSALAIGDAAEPAPSLQAELELLIQEAATQKEEAENQHQLVQKALEELHALEEYVTCLESLLKHRRYAERLAQNVEDMKGYCLLLEQHRRGICPNRVEEDEPASGSASPRQECPSPPGKGKTPMRKIKDAYAEEPMELQTLDPSSEVLA
jgi:chromosome segregation ATPase